MQKSKWHLQPGIFWCTVAAWVALLWWLSSQPGTGKGPRIPHFDKLQHLAYFYCGGIAFQLALRTTWTSLTPRHLIIIGLVFAALIGALDEHHQTYTPGRSGHDALDWLADCLGGLLAALSMNRYRPSINKAS